MQEFVVQEFVVEVRRPRRKAVKLPFLRLGGLEESGSAISKHPAERAKPVDVFAASRR